MVSQDPEHRIAELESELAAAKAGERGGERPAAQWFRPDPVVAAAPADTRLAVPPRRVPVSFLLAELLPFRWWYIFLMFMVAVAPIVLWINTPAAVAPAAVLTLVVIYALQARGAITRRALLKWGRVATVTGSETISRGTYYSGTTWYNSVLPVAHGWTVARPVYSGPNIKTRIHYLLNGYQGDLTTSGREYIDGVILADQRRPQRARCVTFFPYDLDRDDAGNWLGRIRPRLKIGMAAWLIIVIGWLALAAFATDLATTSVDPGATVRISGNGTKKTVNCNGGNLYVGGNDVTVTARGHCAQLTVSGNHTMVVIDSADTVTVSGIRDKVTFHSGSPHVTTSGISNTVAQG